MQRRGRARGLGAVLFTDIVGSTSVAAELGNTRWAELVARHHRLIRRELRRFGGLEIDTAGDGFFATFGRPADAIRCAVAATDAVRELGIEIRAGVSFGELGSVGKKASGLVVNTASRVMSVAGPGDVLVTASVAEIVSGGGISFSEHGTHQLKGLEGEFRLFKVIEVDGVEPVPPLDPDEAAERRREIFPTGSHRRALSVGIAAGVLVLIVAGILLATGGGPQGPAARPPQESVASFDVERGLGERIPVGAGLIELRSYVVQPIAAGEGAVWVLQLPHLLRIDPEDGDIRLTPFESGSVSSHTVATGFDAAWVQAAATVYKVHPGTGEGEIFLRRPRPPGISDWSLALGDAIWFAESDGTLVRSDPLTGDAVRSETGLGVHLLATTRGRLWASDVLEGVVHEIDVDSMMPTGGPLAIGGSIGQLAGRGGFLWSLDRQLGSVTRVNADSRKPSQPARVGDEASGMAVAADAVWVGDLGGWLYRVDASNLQVEPFEIGFEVLGVAVDPADDSVWLYLGRPVESG